MDAFLQNRSRVVKVLGLPGGVTQEELVKWIVRERRGRGESAVMGVWGERGNGDGGWWVLFEEHEDVSLSLRFFLRILGKICRRFPQEKKATKS